jgi:NTP pyrophosphatase (non-canonical NTP hydrolase)
MVGRAVYLKKWDVVGRIYGEALEFDLWLVEGTDGERGAHREDEMEPLYTLSQVTDVVVQQATTPALEARVAQFGMSSEELAQYCADYIVACVARVKGVGNDQYSEGGHQKFEVMELDDLIEYLREELMDVSNYAAMLDIRMRRIQEALQEVDDLGQGTEEEFEQTDYSVEDFEEK